MSRETCAYIDLSALKHNYAVVGKYEPRSKTMAVVKSDAYGHGLVKIANALVKADAFAVATFDEAIQLRDAGITKSIVLLEGFHEFSELEIIAKQNLQIIVHSQWQIDDLKIFSDNNWSILNKNHTPIEAWLKIETGMNRLGINLPNVESSVEQLMKCTCISNNIRCATHLANADDVNDLKTISQVTLFNEIVPLNACQLSVSNSAGIMGWSKDIISVSFIEKGMEYWNRPGIMLYGVSPFGECSSELRPVMTFSSHIISIKECKKGDVVGYGGTWQCSDDTHIGVIAVGYGDGYPRHAPSGTPVLINGKYASLAGRVSMDMICVDLAAIPDAKIGDKVILWGQGLPIEKIASMSGTIGYELLCGVTKRVKFIYG